MTEEKKLSPKERHDLINQKIDEIKELADDCILLAATEDAETDKNVILAGGGTVLGQATLITEMLSRKPMLLIAMTVISSSKEDADNAETND